MTLYDVSVPVQPGMPVWPEDPGVTLRRESSIEEGDQANVSYLSCSVHTGTHLDAPLHFIQGGNPVDQLDLDVLLGEAQVIELLDTEVIDRRALESASVPAGASRLLFKTRNSRFWNNPRADFQQEYVAVDRSGAEWLVEAGVRLVGIDYLSIAPWGQTVEPHQILLSQSVIIIEGLDLRHVPGGPYQLHCLPLKLVGSDGAPARVVLEGD